MTSNLTPKQPDRSGVLKNASYDVELPLGSGSKATLTDNGVSKSTTYNYAPGKGPSIDGPKPPGIVGKIRSLLNPN